MAACILRGEKAGLIPVLEARRVVLAVNVNTARAMGITVPHSVLMRADLVVDDRPASR